MSFRTFAILILGLFAVACGGSSGGRYQPGVRTNTQVSVVQQIPFNAEDFDLATVQALVIEGNVKDAADLEARINDPESGINNIDIDHDENIDFVSVSEERNSDGTFATNLSAQPTSTSWKDGPMVIAVVTVNQTAGTVEAAYPSYSQRKTKPPVSGIMNP